MFGRKCIVVRKVLNTVLKTVPIRADQKPLDVPKPYLKFQVHTYTYFKADKHLFYDGGNICQSRKLKTCVKVVYKVLCCTEFLKSLGGARYF